MKNPTQLTLLIVGLFCTIFPLIWCGVVLIISHASGWQSIAKTYATPSIPVKTNDCSGSIGGSRYSFTLEYAATHEGLYLKTIQLFSIGHKPLFIPWTAMQGYQSGNFYFIYRSKFSVNGTTFYLNEDVKSNVTSKEILQTKN
jgi:hypothetical protein